MSILKFLGFEKKNEGRSQGSSDIETLRKIVSELDQLEPERARYIASFAYLLSRVAHSDLDISDEEVSEMERIVRQIGGLPEEQAVIVVQMAKTRETLFGSTENYLVTREFERLANREQKLALIECLFAVSAADDSISTVEDNEIRQIATELHLDHEAYISTKAAFKDHLAVLNKK